MKRRAILFAAAFLLTGILHWFVGPGSYRTSQSTGADQNRILAALNDYVQTLEQKHVPLAPAVTLDELIQNGFLKRHEVVDWDVKTRFPLTARGGMGRHFQRHAPAPQVPVGQSDLAPASASR